MAKLNLGRVGIVPQGDFDNTKTYSKMDMVYYSTTGSSYVSLVDNNTALPTDSTKWQSAADVSNEVAAANAAATRANTAAEAAEAVSDEVAELKSAMSDSQIEIELIEETIPNTVQTIAFDSSGSIQSITHSRNDSAVRTDAFTFGTSTITEVRALSTGEKLTIVTNTDTLVTTVTYSAE